MGLLSNLRARLGTIGIDPNVSIPPKLTRPLLREPKIELPKIPRRPIGLPPRNISRIREDVGGIIERSLPVGESIPFVPPTIQPDPMPAPMPISPPVFGKPIMQQPRPQPIGVPSLMDPRQPQPNLATGIIEPVSQPIQLEAIPGTSLDRGGPADFTPAALPKDFMPSIPFQEIRSDLGRQLPPKRGDFMSIGGPGGGFTDTRQAINPETGQPYTPLLSASAVRDLPRQNEIGDGMTEPSLIGQEINAPMPMPTSVPEPVTTPVPVTTPAPVTQPEPVTPPASTTVAANQPTETTAPVNVSNQDPFASSVRQVASGLDPLTEQLLFGVGGKGGFIPGAMRAAERTFYDEEGNPIVIDEQVAGFSPDQISAIEMQRQSLGLQDPYIQDARSALQASMQAYDPSITGQFFNPFEDRVVQQTIQDVMEQGAKSDIGALAGDIARGGQSAFGSRARLGAAERQEALGRGLSEALGSLRARGFSEAQRAGMGEFARQKAAQRAGASGIAGLGAQAAGASASDIAALFGMGTQQQTQAQAMLDAQRRNLQQRQMTPLLQYQALQPFVSMAPAGQFQTITDFTPRPSAMMTGIGTGLSAFGSLGNLYGGK